MNLRTITRHATAALVVAILYAPAPGAAADYAPIDCAKAKTRSEKTICSNYGLGQLEARMATLYAWTTSLVAMGQRGDLQDAQRAFIAKREACKSSVTCMANVYADRIKQLDAVMARIAEKGPF